MGWASSGRIPAMAVLRTLGWLICVIYSTIPSFWLMVHPRAHRWRARVRSPFRVLVPAWMTMWIGIAAVTGPWRDLALYSELWAWIPAPVGDRLLHLFPGRGSFQLGSARWSPRGSSPPSRRSSRDQRNPRSRSASGLSRAPLPNVGLERGDRFGGLLVAHRLRHRDRRCDDPNGRPRVGATLRRGVSGVSPESGLALPPIFVAPGAFVRG
jgi:hypothetical protein